MLYSLYLIPVQYFLVFGKCHICVFADFADRFWYNARKIQLTGALTNEIVNKQELYFVKCLVFIYFVKWANKKQTFHLASLATYLLKAKFNISYCIRFHKMPGAF